MSSLPSPDGIRSLRITMDRLAAIDAESRTLRREVAKLSERLSVLTEESNDLARRVPKMLESMDIAQRGNAGWEARVVWALCELARQYTENEESTDV